MKVIGGKDATVTAIDSQKTETAVRNKYTICDMFEQCSFTSYFLLQCAKLTGFYLSSRVSAFFTTVDF